MKKIGMFLVIAMLSAPAFAQEHVGNGGGSHFCAGRGYQEMYDIYEGKTRYGLTFDENQIDENLILQNAIQKIKNINVSVAVEVAAWIDYLNQPGNLVTSFNIKLTRVPDANVLMTDENCEYVQLANWDDVTQKVFVKPSVYLVMSPFHRAALKLHEAIYKVFRIRKKSINSDQARLLVAEVLSLVSAENAMKSISSENDVGSISPALASITLIPIISNYTDHIDSINVHVGGNDLSAQKDLELSVVFKVKHPVEDEIVKIKAQILSDEALLPEAPRREANLIRLRIAKNNSEMQTYTHFINECYQAEVMEMKMFLDLKSSKKPLLDSYIGGQCGYKVEKTKVAKQIALYKMPATVTVKTKIMKTGTIISEMNYDFKVQLDTNYRKDFQLNTRTVTQNQ